MKEAWYRIILAGGDQPALVVAPGAHLGAALDVALARAARGQERWPVAAELATAGDVPLGESVGRGVVVARDAPAEVPAWRWPSGIVPTPDGARRLGAPRDGYVVHRHDAGAALEAVVAGDRVVEVFMQLVEELPSADNIEVRVAGHHGDAGISEVWLTPRLGDVRKVIRFLDDHDVELLGNGHVEVAVYVRAERATLRLTEHKRIVWVAADDEVLARGEAWLAARGVPPLDAIADLTTVDHHHYRPGKSLPRKKLLERLHRMRLRRVDSWPDPPVADDRAGADDGAAPDAAAP
ncbi:MAG: hypothetical protein H6709_07560 [Kofleriaceae bacterium]|nr:hypothetical protein [Kofleriaceae bacterium]MCB9571935.1 hypothetical protein [Kofleriaceae bacterium]